MPRVGGGGGPFVPPQAGQTQQTQKGDFKSKVNQAQAPTQANEAAASKQAKQAAQSQLTGKVKELAKRFANGQLDQKEATREFVSLVIEDQFPQFKKKKRQRDDDDEEETPEEKLEEAVTELIDRDPALATRLKTQFQKLAKGSG